MSSQISINDLSQANQAYILRQQQNQDANNIPAKKNKFVNIKDVFISKNKNSNKIAFIATLALAGSFVINAIKNPNKVREMLDDFKELFMKKKNSIKFDTNKLFDKPIDLDECYQAMKKKLSNIKLDLAFDESKVTNDELKSYFKKLGVSTDWWLDNDVEKVRKHPAKLRALNILSKFDKNDNFSDFRMRFFIEDLDDNATIDEVETYLKMIKSYLQSSDEYISETGKKNLKDIVSCSELQERVFKNAGYNLAPHKTYLFKINEHISENKKEFVNFIGSLKKGTIINDQYAAGIIFKQDNITNYRQARKFYESLRPEVLKKISIYEIEALINKQDINSVGVSEILNKMPDDILKKLHGGDIETYVDFHEFYGVTNINQLNLQQKKKLLKQLVSSNTSSFSSGKKISQILPSNQAEYCKLLDKLAKSIGIDTKALTPRDLTTFNKGIDDIVGSIKSVDLSKVSFELEFSRKDFVAEIEKRISKLSENEKAQVMDYFGFEIKDGILKGYPINVNNGEKLQELSSKKLRKIVEDIRPIVQKFSSTDNKLVIKGASKEFNDSVNELLKGLPELKTMFQKAQHETHAFTLDIHTFKVLQDVCSNPKFEKLSKEDKKVLEIASLLHDITKVEGLRDVNHPIDSAFDAYYIIQKLNLSESQQLKVYELIKTHNWLQQLNNPNAKDMVENIAQDIAFDSRHSNTFELAKILCEADLKSVKKNDSFFKMHEKTLQEMSEKVDGYVKKLHDTQIFLPQTRIPKASKIQNATMMTRANVSNAVLYMDDLGEDLSKYGFEKGTTKENLTALVHALEKEEQMSKFDTFSIIDNEALLSTSFINSKEYKVFRNQGLILDVDSNDIHAGFYRDFGTGYSKSIELLKQDYLFKGLRKDIADSDMWRGDRTQYRDYISDQIKKVANMSDEEYCKKMEKIKNCRSITDIEKVDNEFAQVINKVLDEMHRGKRNGGRNYNEMLVSRPKIQGVFAYNKKYEEIPMFLRKYAQDNDLPIIIFGPKK